MSAFSHAGSRVRPWGFTLVEMMIVVAVIAILTAIAVPNYTQHKIKAHYEAARAFLIDIAQKEEQYMLDNRTYATGANALADLGMTVPSEVSQFYQAPSITPAPPATTYQVVLTPIAGGKMDGNGSYQGTVVISNTKMSASISN